VGKPAEFVVAERRIAVSGRFVRVARLADEWHEDLEDPEKILKHLREAGHSVDIFTFWQRPPLVTPRFTYHRESDPIAALPITTYEHWLKHQINNKTRNLISKAQKRGVVVKVVPFDDELVHGMVRIFNESPIRQGMRFWHYGKDFETVKREFSRYLFREEVIGAYLNSELIGFIFLVDAGRFAMLGQIISMIKHREKAPNNALIAKAVDICATRGFTCLTYAVWPRAGSLRDFKKHNAFECLDLPRYYVPVSAVGHAALALNLHHKPASRIPGPVAAWLKEMRSEFYTWRYRRVHASQQETRV
jgi:hypothetical protein